MPATKHALLGASSAARWLHCPPSVRLTEKIEDQASVYAAEGSLAHEIAESQLRWFVDNGDLMGWEVPDKLKSNDLYYPGMVEDVAPYVGYVIKAFESAGPGAVLEIETRLNYSDYVPEGFGTGDALIIGGGTLEIVDLKFGKGVPVDAEKNPQIMLYGLGGLLAYDFIYDVENVKMTIIQPRLDHVTSYTMTASDLYDWAAQTVQPIAALAYAGEGERATGDWCRWCKIKATCAKRAAELLKAADLMEQQELSDDQISAVLSLADDLKGWLSDVEGYALSSALKGETIPGWKVVEGRSNRKIKDTEELADALLEEYSESDIYKPTELKSLTDLEKLVGKKTMAERYGEYIYKPEGKPTLVPETDKRPAYSLVENQFDFE